MMLMRRHVQAGQEQGLRRGVTVAAVALVAAAVLVLASGMQARGQEGGEPKKSTLYQWTDERGNIHITDDPAKVPQKYHSTVRQMEKFEGPEAEGMLPSGRSGESSGPAPRMRLEETEQFQRSVWQARIREAKEKISAAELRLAELNKQREGLMQLWGGPASGRLEGRLEAARLEAEIQGVQQELDTARHELEVVIPEDARKAGIPAGWLRE